MNWRWTKVKQGVISQTDWSRWLKRNRQIDAYLVWADATAFAGVGCMPGDEVARIPVMFELAEDDSLLEGSSQGVGPHKVFACVGIRQGYKYRKEKEALVFARARFVNGFVAPTDITRLLEADEAIVRFQLGLPRITSGNFDAQPLPEEAGTYPDTTDLFAPRTVVGIIDDGCPYAHPRFMADRDISPSRPPYLTPTNPVPATRVVGLWDQDPARAPDPEARSPGWRPVPDFGYGAQLERCDLVELTTSPSSDFAPYERVDYVPCPPDPESLSTSRQRTREPGSRTTRTPTSLPLSAMLPNTHGAAVMHLAAGVGPTGSVRPPDFGSTEAGPDYAGEWPIAFTQLPTRTALDSSGGSLGVHVLDAVRYVIAQAEQVPYLRRSNPLSMPLSEPLESAQDGQLADWKRLGQYARNRVVVNISYGAIAGPHDGTSMLEMALSELIHQRRYLTIVAAAGNAHHSRSYDRARLEPGSSKYFSWRVGPDNPAESYLEVWLPEVDEFGAPLGERWAERFRVGVKPPGQSDYREVTVGNAIIMEHEHVRLGKKADVSIPAAGLVFARRVAQGRNGTMCLLAVAPTRPGLLGAGSGRPCAPHGEWLVEVSYTCAEGPGVIVRAWTERGDLLYGARRPQQSTLVSDAPIPEPTEFTPEYARVGTAGPGAGPYRVIPPDYSLGSLANGQVGASEPLIVGSHRQFDGEMSLYSSSGPAVESSTLPCHRESPDFDAPGDVGVATRGLTIAGMLPGINKRVSGTSVSAPIVARFLANCAYAATVENQVPSSDMQQLIARNVDTAGVSEQPLNARATPAPRMDDRYRKGRVRLRRSRYG